MLDLSEDPVDPEIRARRWSRTRPPKLHPHTPSLTNICNSPSNLCLAIDQFGIEEDLLMTTGPPKLEIIIFRPLAPKPKIVLEFGSYTGWGAVAFGGLLRELHPDAKPGEVKLFTFEVDPLFAAITSNVVEFAGLKDIVNMVVGTAEDSLRHLKVEGVLGRADIVLLDHWEKFYLSDLQILEELGVIGGGSVVFADNTVRAPGYLEYVRDGKGRSGVEMRSESVGEYYAYGD